MNHKKVYQKRLQSLDKGKAKSLGPVEKLTMRYAGWVDGRHGLLRCENGTWQSSVLKQEVDHIKTGGTLLNQKFTPSLLSTEEGCNNLVHLIRAYFRMDGHHIQFNVVDADTLREAQKHPEDYRDLIVRVAGYSDYFNDLGEDLQNEIICRTEQTTF